MRKQEKKFAQGIDPGFTHRFVSPSPRSHPHTKLSAEENKQLTAGTNWPSPKLEASCSEKATFHPQSTAELSLVFRSPCCSTVPCNRTYQNHSHPQSPIQMIFFLCTAFNHFRPTTAVSHRIKSIHLLYHLFYAAFFFMYYLNIY